MAIGASRTAKVVLTADSSGVKRGADDARRTLRSMERDTASASQRATREAARAAKEQARVRQRAIRETATAARRGGGMLAGAAGGAMTLVGGGAIGGITDALSGVLDFEKAMVRLQISGEMSNEMLASFRTRIAEVSAATGRAREDVLGVAGAFVRQTGDTKNAKDQLELFTKVMQATGTDAEATAGLFALMEKSLKLDPKDWQKGADMFIKAGHLGGAELPQFVNSFREAGAEYAAMFSGGNTLKGQQHALAIFQKLVDETGNAEVAADRFKETLKDFPQDAKKLAKELHINPYTIDPKTKQQVMKDGLDLLHEVSDKLGKDKGHRLEILQKVFPDQRGRGAIAFLTENIDGIDELNEKLGDSNQLQKDYDTYSQSSSARMEKAWNDVKLALTDAFDPKVIASFAAGVEKVLAGVVSVIGKIEGFLHQPTKEEGARATDASLTWQSMAGGEDDAIDRAKRAMTMSEKEFNQLAMEFSDEGKAAASSGSHQNYTEGARQYLARKGYEMDSYGLNVVPSNDRSEASVRASARDVGAAARSGDTAALARAIDNLARKVDMITSNRQIEAKVSLYELDNHASQVRRK